MYKQKLRFNHINEKDPMFMLSSHYISFTLRMAYELGLFDKLKEPKDLSIVAKELNIAERALQAVLSVCCTTGLVTVNNNKLYGLTDISKYFFTDGSPGSLGRLIGVNVQYAAEALSYNAFKNAVLLNNSVVYEKQDIFKVHEQDAKAAENFTCAMHFKSLLASSIWPKVIDLSSHQVMLDIGGGSGVHTIGACKIYPNLKGIILEIPTIGKIAQKYIEEANLRERIGIIDRNMWKDDFPQADIHFYSDIFHDWPLEKNKMLVKKSYEQLSYGGEILIHEIFFNDEKSGPLSAALYNCEMLLWTSGQQLSKKEIFNMLKEVGFKNIQIIPTGLGDFSIAVGKKC